MFETDGKSDIYYQLKISQFEYTNISSPNKCKATNVFLFPNGFCFFMVIGYRRKVYSNKRTLLFRTTSSGSSFNRHGKVTLRM
jgi:hypothetical protein